MLDLLTQRWWLVLIRGVTAVVFGTLAILWPGLTLLTLLFVFGAFTVADGLTALWIGFSTKSHGRIWWEMVFAGVLAILFGLFVALQSELTAIAFVYVIAFFAVLRGAVEIAAAIQLRKVIDDEWMLILSGVVSLLFGGILLVRPGDGALAMVQLIGAFLIAAGGMTIALAMRLRHLGKRVQAQRTVTPPPA